MLTHEEATFAAELDQQIRVVLGGNDKVPGLYKAMFNSQNWESFLYMKGKVEAFEAVRAMMREIERRTNEENVRSKDGARAAVN